MLAKPSMWIFGGDGWAYDIGYGGLDHVLASGENVNVMVFDTEVYSNTGGQSSKATPIRRRRQVCCLRKSGEEKGSGPDSHGLRICIRSSDSYGRRILQQTLKAIREAESYDGPSLIIAYAPCINHGVKAGMNKAMAEDEDMPCVSGYWNLASDTIRSLAERRQESAVHRQRSSLLKATETSSWAKCDTTPLKLKFPDRAEKLFEEAEELAKERYETLLSAARRVMDTVKKGGWMAMKRFEVTYKRRLNSNMVPGSRSTLLW